MKSNKEIESLLKKRVILLIFSITLTVICIIMLGISIYLQLKEPLQQTEQTGWSYSPDGKYAILTLSREKPIDIQIRKEIHNFCEIINQSVCISSLDLISEMRK